MIHLYISLPSGEVEGCGVVDEIIALDVRTFTPETFHQFVEILTRWL